MTNCTLTEPDDDNREVVPAAAAGDGLTRFRMHSFRMRGARIRPGDVIVVDRRVN